MSGLRDVLEQHDWFTPRGYAWPCCTCGEEFPDGESAAYNHVAAAVLDWLRARLASDEVREDVAVEIHNAQWHDEGDCTDPRGCGQDMATTDAADAALTAVLAALEVER